MSESYQQQQQEQCFFPVGSSPLVNGPPITTIPVPLPAGPTTTTYQQAPFVPPRIVRSQLDIASIPGVQLSKPLLPLPALVPEEKIDKLITEIVGAYPDLRFEETDIKARRDFLGRVEKQITKAQHQIRSWNLQKDQASVVQHLDDSISALRAEKKVLLFFLLFSDVNCYCCRLFSLSRLKENAKQRFVVLF